jgi:hypothetical protein
MTRPASRFRIIDYPTRRHTRLESAHEAQLLSYLKAAEFEVGLLLNLVTVRNFAACCSTMLASKPRAMRLRIRTS